jgi:hypothetical protein
MALLLIEGFDDGLLGNKGWTNSGTATTGRITGNAFSPRWQNPGVYYIFPTPPASTLVIGFALQVFNYTSDRPILSVGQARLKYKANGFLALCRVDTDAQVAITSAVHWPSDGIWRHVECKYNATTGVTSVRIDGIVVLSGTVPVSAAVANLLWGGTGALEHSIDDLYILDTTGTINNDFLGDVRVQTYLPSADGANTGMTPSTGTTHYNLVDEAAPNTTDYVSTSSAGVKDTYQFPDLSANTGNVFGVAATNYAHKDATGSAGIANVVRSSGTNYTGTAIPLSTGWTASSQTWEVNPATGAPWSASEVNNAEFGVEST